MKEIRKNIVGFDKQYIISNYGILYIVKKDKEKEVKSCKNNGGYLLVKMYHNSKRKSFTLSNLVADNFLDNPFNSKKVTYKDKDKFNCRADNLEWVRDYVKERYYEKERNCYIGLTYEEMRKLNPKRRTKFPDTVVEIKEEIKSNTNKKNKENNNVIIKLLYGNDKEYLRIIYQKYYNKLYTHTKTLIKHYNLQHDERIVITDIVHDTLLKSIDKIKAGRFNGCSLLAWLQRILKSILVDEINNNLNKLEIFNNKDYVENIY